MKRELGIAGCGLACCLCSENEKSLALTDKQKEHRYRKCVCLVSFESAESTAYER